MEWHVHSRRRKRDAVANTLCVLSVIVRNMGRLLTLLGKDDTSSFLPFPFTAHANGPTIMLMMMNTSIIRLCGGGKHASLVLNLTDDELCFGTFAIRSRRELPMGRD